MLRELHISNLAIIEQVDIELGPGLNVFTGQTGSGKSLILGALELLLGLRGGGEEAAVFVRPGCAEARVSGLFELADSQAAGRLGRILDQELPAGEPVLITRRLSAAGRSSVSVNGSPVTAAMLRAAGELLVDIHGQHDQQYLLKSANQVLILDSFAGATQTRERFAEALQQLRQHQRRLETLQESEDRRREALELYRFQIEELDKAALQAGEYEQLKARHAVLKNAAHLKVQAAEAMLGLSEGDDSLLDRLGKLKRTVHGLARLDGSLAQLVGQLDQADELLGDAARAMSRYQDALEVDEGELAQVEERLDVLNRMIHKYARSAPPGADPAQAVLEYRQQIGRRAGELESEAESLGLVGEQIDQARGQLAEIGGRLTGLRRQAAKRLRSLVEKQFRELEMNEAAFDVQINTRCVDDPAVDSSGLDEIEFLVRTNPGQEMLPLRKIASGGEMSRIMLAVKTILADKDQVGVLVFDEIDANIGDRLGATIGRKMRALTNPQGKPAGADAGGGHQVICVTHLSQIAACADRHLQISKQVVGSDGSRRTVAKVRVLEGQDRVVELAEMMAGRNTTPATLSHARNLLSAACPAKPSRPAADRRASSLAVTVIA